MLPLFEYALWLTWLAVLAYWLWSARTAKAAASTETLVIRLGAYWLPLAVAGLLLGPDRWFGDSWLGEPFVAHGIAAHALGLGLAVAGAVTAIYSRRLLGRNWSATVQLKQDHELITRGPYRFVRHPIYTGYLLLFLGSAVVVGDWRGLLAVAIVLASFWRKLRLEEAWLGKHFGEPYDTYRRSTKALLPIIL
ncbi:MAG: isoprenylcysteine carboxylmethyltransferase family protein [Pseudomonadota bacterium]|nr:isoprenylcysteine carboxylmethyltransferase family protein [Pseudomonadota bacterium]